MACSKSDFYGKDPQFFEKDGIKTISLREKQDRITIYYGTKECTFEIKDKNIFYTGEYIRIDDKRWELTVVPREIGESTLYMLDYTHTIIDSCRVNVVR